ncbi:hypothetical protein [Virgibacillus ainsalahensis]
MNIIHFSNLAVADFQFTLFVQEHRFIFFLAIVTFALSIILRTKKLFFGQLLLFLIIFTINESAIPILYYLLIAVQSILAAAVIYKFKKAVDRNYTLVIEKTHEIPPDLTKGGHDGTQSTFF